MNLGISAWLVVFSALLLPTVVALGDYGELLPGYLTDASAGSEAVAGRDGYVTPECLRDPYVSTYFIEPTVFEGARVRIGYYVTDWFHSRRRLLDDSKRFDVTIRYSKDLKNWREKVNRNVPSGDGAFDLGALEVGEWTLSVQARDRANGLVSHVVWQEFRVLPASERTIPADKVYRMTKADLATYGIRNDGDYERLVLIDVPTNAPVVAAKTAKERKEAGCKVVADYLAAHPHQADPSKRPGYAAYVPACRGVPAERAFEMRQIFYDPGYDRALVETNAVRTLEGLQKFLDDKAAAGFRTIVLLPGTYRVSGTGTLAVPDRVRLDLGGATIKMNAVPGDHAMIVKLGGVTDAALENGVVEGDYYEHDYTTGHHAEWLCGWNVCGASRYCEVRNVTLRNITGYGGNNGRGEEGPGGWYTYSTNAAKNVVELQKEKLWRVTAPGLCTTAPVDLGAIKPFKFLSVSYLGGYQGMKTHNWNLTVEYLDASGQRVSTERMRQYRVSLIPPAAASARFTIEADSPKEAVAAKLSMFLLKAPVNCIVRDCRFERVRCVGYALFACRNYLIENCTFRQTGEDLAKCAFDAEDGWDGMQDVTLRNNDFRDNPNNGIVTCCGHNFTIEGNRGRLCLWERSNSFCVRSNDLEWATLKCGWRYQTGYWRYDDNAFGSRLGLGGGHVRGDWEVILRGATFDGAGRTEPPQVSSGATGVFRDCTFRGVRASPGAAENCRFEKCDWGWSMHNSGTWRDCTATDCRFPRVQATNFYERCTFRNVRFDPIVWSGQYFRDCTLEDFTMVRNGKEGVYTGAVVRCTLKGKTTLAKDTEIRKDENR